MPFYGNASKRHTGLDGDPRLGEQPGRDVSACCVIGERVGISQAAFIAGLFGVAA